MNSTLDATGKVYQDGIVVFDPAVDPIEQIQPDTFANSQGTITGSTVVATNPVTNTRAVYSAPKANATQYTKNWFNELISAAKTVTGTVKVGAGAAVAATTVTLSQNSTHLIAQFDMPSNLGNQAAFNAGGSLAVITEADGQTVSFTVAVS
jgi:hypothetical protein